VHDLRVDWLCQHSPEQMDISVVDLDPDPYGMFLDLYDPDPVPSLFVLKSCSVNSMVQ
jgi:hypothetical protein